MSCAVVTMVIALRGCVGHDDLYAAVRSVVSSFPLLPVAVAYIVRILLVKLREREISWKTDRQTDRQINRQTCIQTDMPCLGPFSV